MPVTSIQNFVGNVVDFNLFIEQNSENTVAGNVMRRIWNSYVPNVSSFKNHMAYPYSTLSPMDENSMKPTELLIRGGELQNTAFRRYASTIKMDRDNIDYYENMIANAETSMSLESMINMQFAKAGLQTYLLTSEALLHAVLTNESFYEAENIKALTTPINTSNDIQELIEVITEAVKTIKINAGGELKYEKDDVTKVEKKGANSNVKVVVPLSVMNKFRAYSKIFKDYMPYGGYANDGKLLMVDNRVIQDLFMDAHCFTPTTITVELADATTYQAGKPKFMFDDPNAIYVYYNGDSELSPSSLILHETKMETEYEADIFGREIDMMQKKAVELKQPDTMIKIKNLFA